MLRRVSTYSVVVALHIIAAFAAYGLPLAYPLLLPYLRRHHPEALPGVHAIQYRLNVAPHRAGHGRCCSRRASTSPPTATSGASRSRPPGSSRSRSSRVVGGAVIVPATKRLAALDPDSRRVRRDVFRRYLAAEIFLAAVVLLAIFAMAAKPFS